MNILIIFSYIANVLILIPICFLLLKGNNSLKEVYGSDSTARQILVCMYLAILILSSYYLIKGDTKPFIAWVLLGFQIIYKSLSLIIIKDKKAPVYWFNLGVAILHSITLLMNPL